MFLAFTGIIDPYGVSPIHVFWPGVNQYKPQRINIDRLIKPYEVWKYQPRTVFMGTSRIQQSIDPSVLDRTSYAPAYNASIPASTLKMNVSHLRRYIELDSRLQTVVVELFLYNFIGKNEEKAPERFVDFLTNTVSLFASTDALQASFQTLSYNLLNGQNPTYEIKPSGHFYYPPGHNAKATFDTFASEIWKLHQTRAGWIFNEPAFDSVREIIEICHDYKLNLIFLLTPNHIYDDYYIDKIGAWKIVEEWLRRVSADALVYSFSQPNSWVDEPVKENMRYWNDPYHFSLVMGRAIELGLLGEQDGGIPKGFMIHMTPDKVLEHVESRKQAVRSWELENAYFGREFEKQKQKWELSHASAKKDESPN